MLPSTETFGISELLELILEYATLQELLPWQRVNKTWQAVIKGSPHIQEKLFFKAKMCNDITELRRAMWNPFLRHLPRPEHLVVVSCYYLANNIFDGKASYPTASWRQMFVTSPAIAKLIISLVDDTGDNYHCIAKVPMRCETGITIGQVADKVKECINMYAGDIEVDVFVHGKPNKFYPSREDYISWMASD